MNAEDLKQYFDAKFAELAAKASSSNRVAAEKPVVLKKRGNQNQLDHAQEVLLSVKSAQAALEEGDHESVCTHLMAANKALNKRIKVIRLADKSENGWDTVKEYLSDELASDSEDERRIKKAESEARRKRKAREQTFAGKNKKNFTEASTSGFQSSSNSRQFFLGNQSRARTFKYEDRCYACGKAGHCRIHCPDIKKYGGQADQKPGL